jgi:hypothetical protein
MDMESLQKIVKKLTNKIVYLKMNFGEGRSNKKFFKTPFKKTAPPIVDGSKSPIKLVRENARW